MLARKRLRSNSADAYHALNLVVVAGKRGGGVLQDALRAKGLNAILVFLTGGAVEANTLSCQTRAVLVLAGIVIGQGGGEAVKKPPVCRGPLARYWYNAGVM